MKYASINVKYMHDIHEETQLESVLDSSVCDVQLFCARINAWVSTI